MENKYESIAARHDGRLVVGCCEISPTSTDIIFNIGSILKPAIAAMHGPHSVLDKGLSTVIHCVSLAAQWKAE